MQRQQREFDVVVWGATGFTGRLVVEYLAASEGTGGNLRWAAAARNPAKLATVCAAIPGLDAARLPQLQADSGDPESLGALARRSRVIISTVGPYALYGSALVQACAENGTDYCDLSGELQWIRQMIERWDAPARSSGARLVHCCGFDSVPFDMGVWYLQRTLAERGIKAARHIEGVVRRIKGSFSGGTYASMLNFVREAAADPALRRMAADPNALLPAGTDVPRAPRTPERARWQAELGTWTAPWVMAAINTRVVRRSNALLGFPWGRDFRYDETMGTGTGTAGRLRALGVQAGLGMFMACAALKPTRALLEKLLPAPGEGPDAEARRSGGYEIDFVVRDTVGAAPMVRVSGDMDPGYGSTAKMLAECALCLAFDSPTTGGGSWTPAAALGEALLERLERRAGLSFAVRDP